MGLSCISSALMKTSSALPRKLSISVLCIHNKPHAGILNSIYLAIFQLLTVLTSSVIPKLSANNMSIEIAG